MSPSVANIQSLRLAVFGFGACGIVMTLPFCGGCGATHQVVHSVAFSRDGTTVAAGLYNYRNANNPEKLYSADDCETVEIIAVDGKAPSCVVVQDLRRGEQGPRVRRTPVFQFVDGGRALAILLWDRDSRFETWDLTTRRKLSSECGPDREIWGFAYSPDGDTVAIGTNNRLSIRDIASAREVRHVLIDGPAFRVGQLTLARDQKLFTFVDSCGVMVWDTGSWDLQLRIQDTENERTTCAAISGDGRLVAAATFGAIRLWRADKGETGPFAVVRNATGGFDRHLQIAFLPDNKTLVAAGGYGIVLVDAETGHLRGRIGAPPNAVLTSVAVSADGNLLATGDDRGYLTFWDVATKTKIREVPIHGKFIMPWTVPLTVLIAWISLLFPRRRGNVTKREGHGSH